MNFTPNGYCMTCGMKILPIMRVYKRRGIANNKVHSLPKTFCDRHCAAMYKKYPDQFGHWWQSKQFKKEPDCVKNFDFEAMYEIR